MKFLVHCSGLSETSTLSGPDGLSLRLVSLEHRQQLRDRQQIFDALRQVEQLEATTLAAYCRVGPHYFAETRAVDVRHPFEIQQQLLAARREQAVDLVLQQLITLAEGHLALQVENGDLVHRALGDFHAPCPLTCVETLDKQALTARER
jgi:hypothetical protein